MVGGITVTKEKIRKDQMKHDPEILRIKKVSFLQETFLLAHK
jgi:hypothetical protein